MNPVVNPEAKMLRPHLKSCSARTSMVLFSACLLTALCGVVRNANAQSSVSYDDALSTTRSRAAKEAEEKVSLSADKIIDILRDEPGLLLQVKKLLVIKAYEQGRILDPSDLTDNALFRLLRDDDTIRVLATREIEDRYYVRAKPSREEIERKKREEELEAQRGLTRTSESKVTDQSLPSKSK